MIKRDYGWDFYLFGFWVATLNTACGSWLWSGYPFKAVTVIFQFRRLGVTLPPPGIDVEGRDFEWFEVLSAAREWWTFKTDEPLPRMCEVSGCNHHAEPYQTHYNGVYLFTTWYCPDHAKSFDYCINCTSSITESAYQGTGYCSDCTKELSEAYKDYDHF